MAEAGEAGRLKALAHPRRQGIMGVILGGGSPVSPREIADELGEPLSALSYHVRVLADCEMIRLEEARDRGNTVQHFYAPHPDFMALPWAPAVLASFIAEAE